VRVRSMVLNFCAAKHRQLMLLLLLLLLLLLQIN
jgi:hypothetical protein